MRTTARTITVAGHPIRLFEAPERGFAFPWVAFDDLLRAAELSPECAADWAWRWLSAWPERSHSLPDGQLIIPYFAARGLFEFARVGGWVHADRALHDFEIGSSGYFAALYRHLNGAEFRVALNEAVLRSAVCGVAH